MIKRLAAISLLFFAAPANALSISCSDKSNAAFNASDAVVLARADILEPTSSETPSHFIAKITVLKYWKRKNGMVPKEVHLSTNMAVQGGLYIMFLKQYKEGVWQLEVCSPLVGLHNRPSLEPLFDLKDLPLHEISIDGAN